MATRRILTRLQAKKQDNLQARKESSPSKRKASVHLMEGMDDENALVVDSSEASLSKSYPLEHDVNTRKMSRRKVFRTENPGKQRHLSDRGVNFLKSTNVTRKESIMDDESSFDVCKTESQSRLDEPDEDKPSAAEFISQEEITELEEQTSVDEPVYDEAMAAGLPHLLKVNSHGPFPRFYNSPFIVESSMDTDPWRGRSERRTRPIPRGVVDIDFDADTLDTCIYSFDIHEYLKHKETQCPIPPSFLEMSPEVTPRMRGVLMDWLIQVQVHEELEEETLLLCVAIIDRYLASVRVRMPRLQLVGITCLLVATKFLERFAPEISTLCYLTADSFKRSQVIRYEMQVLLTLAFDLSFPVATTFLRRYLQVHNDEQPPEVTSLSHYLIDLSITSAKMSSVLPSLLAASAIYLSRRLVLGIHLAWTPSLAYYTSYDSPAVLTDIVNELASLLFKAPTSKFQAARNKYNTENHNFVSHSQFTSAQIIETHFATQVSSV